MKRRYTLDQKLEAIRRLAANAGNAAMTHEQTGIPETTLRQWGRKHKALSDAEQLFQLRQSLIAEALVIASHLKQVVTEAPLNQRATALNQMIDKILKITEVLEEDESNEKERVETLQIEFVDETGKISSTPPWAEEDSE
jgi:hypothetical protein